MLFAGRESLTFAWPPGRLAAWPPGRLAAWPPGRLAAWPPGRLAAWPICPFTSPRQDHLVSSSANLFVRKVCVIRFTSANRFVRADRACLPTGREPSSGP